MILRKSGEERAKVTANQEQVCGRSQKAEGAGCRERSIHCYSGIIFRKADTVSKDTLEVPRPAGTA